MQGESGGVEHTLECCLAHQFGAFHTTSFWFIATLPGLPVERDVKLDQARLSIAEPNSSNVKPFPPGGDH